MLGAELRKTLDYALDLAAQRKHEFATLEHLLLALTEDASASRGLQSVNADLARLRLALVSYLDTKLDHIKSERTEQAKPTAGFQRCLQHAAIAIQSAGGTEITGAALLISIFSERESHAAYFLQEQAISRNGLVNFVRTSEMRSSEMQRP